MKFPSKPPFERNELRTVINKISEVASEWSAVIGELPEESEQRELQKVLDDIAMRLSRLSFNLHRRGMEAAEPGDLT